MRGLGLSSGMGGPGSPACESARRLKRVAVRVRSAALRAGRRGRPLLFGEADRQLIAGQADENEVGLCASHHRIPAPPDEQHSSGDGPGEPGWPTAPPSCEHPAKGEETRRRVTVRGAAIGHAARTKSRLCARRAGRKCVSQTCVTTKRGGSERIKVAGMVPFVTSESLKERELYESPGSLEHPR